MTTEPTPPAATPEDRDSGIVRKTVVGMAGGIVTAAGLVMMVTPGPGIIVTLAGLGILSREFPSVRSQMERLRPRRTAEPHPDNAGTTDNAE